MTGVAALVIYVLSVTADGEAAAKVVRGGTEVPGAACRQPLFDAVRLRRLSSAR